MKMEHNGASTGILWVLRKHVAARSTDNPGSLFAGDRSVRQALAWCNQMLHAEDPTSAGKPPAMHVRKGPTSRSRLPKLP